MSLARTRSSWQLPLGPRHDVLGALMRPSRTTPTVRWANSLLEPVPGW